MKVEMPWEGLISVNAMRFGKPSPKARGKWKKQRVRKPEVQAWMSRLAWEVKKAQRESGWVPSGRVLVVVDFRYPDRRHRDSHNFFKAISDAVANGLDMDDKDIRILAGEIEIDKAKQGFTITVQDA